MVPGSSEEEAFAAVFRRLEQEGAEPLSHEEDFAKVLEPAAGQVDGRGAYWKAVKGRVREGEMRPPVAATHSTPEVRLPMPHPHCDI